jgi:hypothetical protein
MSYIIVARNPMNKLIVTMNEDEWDRIAEFDTEEAADEIASSHPLFCAWGWQVLEVWE